MEDSIGQWNNVLGIGVGVVTLIATMAAVMRRWIRGRTRKKKKVAQVRLDGDYALTLAALSIRLAREIAFNESNGDRQAKMRRVISEKEEEFADVAKQLDRPASELDKDREEALSPKDKIKVMIDLLFSNPFLPYQLEFGEERLVAGWTKIGLEFGVEKYHLDQICQTQREAKKVHSGQLDWLKIGLIGGAVAALFAVGGWIVAPLIGGVVGAGAAGLAGAAATAHGLALLGGGSLAAGGMGMAGGMWLVALGAAGAGGVVGGASQLVAQLGAEQFQTEVVKLQVTLKVMAVARLISPEELKGEIRELEKRLEELEASLGREKERNEANSKRLKDVETKATALRKAILWLRGDPK